MQLGRLWHFCNACHWITISYDTLHNLLWRSDNFTIPTRMIMINNICDNTQQRITIIDQNNQYSYQYNMCAQGTSVYLSTFTLTAIALDRSHHWVLLFCIVVIFVLLLFCIFVIFVFLYFFIFFFLFVFCRAQAPIKIVQTGSRARKSRTVASLASAAISECT